MWSKTPKNVWLYTNLHEKFPSSAICIFGLLCLASTTEAANAKWEDMTDDYIEDGVCYDVVGCFGRQPPFDNAGGLLPDPPETVDTLLRLHTPKGSSVLDYLDKTRLEASRFDPSLPTVVIIHGFAFSKERWMYDMVDSFVDKGDSNVITVDWTVFYPNYPRAVSNARLVARIVAMSIRALMSSKNLNPSKVHLIGHSLGAHICGYVGHLLGSRVGRITGLDPAGAMFATHPSDVRLDPSDAIFVDVIHSNGPVTDINLPWGFGTLLPSGHVDFYPNGGDNQPGCHSNGGAVRSFFGQVFKDPTTSPNVVDGQIRCSTKRAAEIFVESISASSCQFKAIPCASYDDFLSGKCVRCGPKGCNYAGLQTDPELQGGLQFFQTNNTEPLCGHSYLVTVETTGRTDALRGKLSITLQGDLGQRTLLWAAEKPLQRLETFEKTLGSIYGIELKYQRKDLLARRAFSVRKVTIEPLGEKQRFVTKSQDKFKVIMDSFIKKSVAAENVADHAA